MSWEDRVHEDVDGAATMDGAAKPPPRPGYQAVLFEEGIRLLTTDKNENWRQLLIPVKIAEGDDEGKGWNIQWTLTSGTADEGFANQADGNLATLIRKLEFGSKYVAELKADGVNVDDHFFITDGNFDYKKTDAVVNKLKGFLPGIMMDTIIELVEESGSKGGKFMKPYIRKYALYGKSDFDKTQGTIPKTSSSPSGSDQVDTKDWG